MEDALMAVCWLSIAGHLLDSCRQVCRQSAGGGPLMEGRHIGSGIVAVFSIRQSAITLTRSGVARL